jgi:hypothetical protein
MNIKLHKNARTTPAVRAEIAASTERACVLAARYGVTEATIYKWKKRDSFVDKSHTANRLQTTLSAAQEAIVVQLRKTLFLPLDDLLAVTREFLCHCQPDQTDRTSLSKSGCLSSNLKSLTKASGGLVLPFS